MDIQEINTEISRLENGPTTYSTCDKLATLYIVRDGMQTEEGRGRLEPYSFSAAPASEFEAAARAADPERMIRVLDKHMDAIKILYPKEYRAILRKLAEE